jgi:hypothetical protein
VLKLSSDVNECKPLGGGGGRGVQYVKSVSFPAALAADPGKMRPMVFAWWPAGVGAALAVLGGAAQVDGFKTRLEGAHGFSA